MSISKKDILSPLKKISLLVIPLLVTVFLIPSLTSAALPNAVGQWKFDETTGTTAVDSSSNRNNGTISGAIRVTGQVNNGLSFDGVNDFVRVTDSASLDIGQQITLAAWIRPRTMASNNSQDRVIDKANAYNLMLSTNDTGCRAGGNGDVVFRLYLTNGTNRRICGGDLPLNTWSHITATYNGSQMKIYVNGILKTTFTQTGTIVTNTQHLFIGNRNAADRPFDGIMDEAAIWNRALTATEVTELFQGNAVPTPTPTLTPTPTPTPTPTLTPTPTPTPPPGGPYPPSTVISSVDFDTATHQRFANGSDNWPTTWADNGHIYTAWGDGGGFGGTGSNGRVSLGVGRVQGTGTSYQGFNVNGGVNPESGNTTWPDNGTEGKSYGLVSIEGTLYMWVTGGKTSNIFNQVRLYRSTDKGATWTPASWNFTNADDLVVPTILQFGQDYAGARDNYVYHYFIELQDSSTSLNVQVPGRIHLLRVDKNNLMASKSNYQYFAGLDGSGNPTWSSNINNKQPVFEDPNGVGWNMAVSYNAGLQRYILTTEHTDSQLGYLGIFDAPEPWGPWTTVLYDENGNWEGFNNSAGQGDGTFQWNFPTKWISADGRSFTMVFTGGNPGPLDSWNTIEGTFTSSAALVVSNLTVASGKAYQIVNNALTSGDQVYIDRTFTFSTIPSSVLNKTYIMTANDDKNNTSSNFLSFTINQQATVVVAYDTRATSLPNWLSGWTNTGQTLGTTDVNRKLYSKVFPPGTVTLGGNKASPASGANSNYNVIVYK